MIRMEKVSTAVDGYIAGFPEEIRHIMEGMRTAIHAAVPDLEEKINWGMPTFFRGSRRVHFAANKHHLGFYPGPGPILVFSDELKPYVTSKGAVQFPYSQPVPLELVGRMVKLAMAGPGAVAGLDG